MFVNIEAEEQGEVDDGQGQDDRPEEDALQAVAEVLLVQEPDRVGPPDNVRDQTGMAGPVDRKPLEK